MYSETTFHFSSPNTVSAFAKSLPITHLNAIQSISIDWEICDVVFDNMDQKWQKLWDTLSVLQSLKEVRLLVIKMETPHWHEEFQWRWKHEGMAKRIETEELKVDFWNFGVRIPAVFGEDERRDLPSTYVRPAQNWGPEWYQC